MDIRDYLVEKAVFRYGSSATSKIPDAKSSQSLDNTKSDAVNKTASRKDKPNILLVEDDLAVRIIYSEYIKRLNCDCTTAASGEKAFLFYSKADLILLDISLPDVSGAEVCRRIRQQSDGRTLPIIAFTALDRSVDPEWYEAGFNYVALKPLPVAELYEILYYWLPQYRSVIQNIEGTSHE